MRSLAVMHHNRKIQKHGLYGDPFDQLRSKGAESFTIDSSDENAVLVNGIRAGIIKGLESEYNFLVSPFKDAVPVPATDWCPGYCNIDREEAEAYLKKMHDFLKSNSAQAPKTVVVWNSVMDTHSPSLKIAKQASSADTTASETSSNTSSGGKTSSSSNLPSDAQNGNGEKSGINPLVIGGGVAGLALILFLVLRKK